jgi:hypothetical protein
MLPGHCDISLAAARPCQIQLCALLGSSGIKISEYHSKLNPCHWVCNSLALQVLIGLALWTGLPAQLGHLGTWSGL